MRYSSMLRFKTNLPEILADVWRRLARAARFHAAPLLAVLAVTLAGQALVLAGGQRVVIQGDTVSYTKVSALLLNNIWTPDNVRTPGYPLFLAATFWITGSSSLAHVVYAQAALFVLSALEVYALIFITTGRRWVGALIATLVGGNIYLANWSRIILSEPLTTWLLISALLCFIVYLRRPSYTALTLLSLAVAVSVFTRPQMIYLPALLLALLVFRALRQERPRAWLRALRPLWPALAGLGAAYGLLLLYMYAFLLNYGQFTTTQVANISLLGVAMRDHAFYGMPYDGAEPKYARLRADLDAFTGPSVYVFLDTHPQYDSLSGQFYGTFGSEVLRAHPGYLALGAYQNFMQMTKWSLEPSYLAPIPLAPSWLLNIAQYISLIYACLPLLLVASLVALWRNPSSPRAAILSALMLVVVAHIFTGAIADFGAFSRLRMPVDWAMLAVTVLAIIQIFEGGETKITGLSPLLAGNPPESGSTLKTDASATHGPPGPILTTTSSGEY